ncbi:MAG: hypothetical protein AB8F34_16750 [Akkermansiaceae bacterium]
MKMSAGLLFLGLFLCKAAFAEEKIIKDSQGMDCHLYLPSNIGSGKTYQLLVGVHGAGGRGNGAAGLKKWAERGDVIVIGPSFQTKGQRPYQNGDGEHAKKLIDLFKKLGADYRLKEKMFLHGFSGGSQFAHRFAMNFPQYVCGVSAHSGGTWSTDGYGQINARAKKIPFAISCGEKDAGLSFAGAKYGRLEWYKRFRDEIDKKKFCYIGGVWPGVGHRASPQMWDIMQQCFQLATGLPGASADKKVEISGNWENLDKITKVVTGAMAGGNKGSVPYVDPSRLAKITQAAFARADKEQISDAKLVAFMEKYPPVLWKDKPGADKLIQQCKKAAINWRESALKSGRFKGDIRRKFENFTLGLALPEPASAD